LTAEHAQQMANHESPRTTKLYDSTNDAISLDEIAYCVKCRKTQTVGNATIKETANGRKMAQGTCPVCGTKVTRFLSSKKTA